MFKNTTEVEQDILELQFSTQKYLPYYLVIGAFIMLFFVLPVFIGTLMLFVTDPITFFGLLLLALVSGMFTLVMSILPLYAYFSVVSCRLHVNKEEICYQSNLAAFLQGWIPPLFPKDWSVRWQDVSSLQIKKSKQSEIEPSPYNIVLKIHTKEKILELFPCQWVNSKYSYLPEIERTQTPSLKPLSYSKLKNKVMSSLLMSYIQKNNVLTSHNIELLVDKDIAIYSSFATIKYFLLYFLFILLAILINAIFHIFFVSPTPF